MNKTLLGVSIVLAVGTAGCKSPYYADKGAALGAAAGALTGAAIGNNNGNTAAGAIIGTAVGAITGAAIGESIDADVARNNAIIEQRMGRRMAGAVSIGDAISLTQAGLSDDVIISHIKANGVAAPLKPADLITLNQNGVRDPVIKAMQNPPPPPPPSATPRPIVVEERHYVAPVYSCDPCYWHHPPHFHHRHRTGVHWGVTFHD